MKKYDNLESAGIGFRTTQQQPAKSKCCPNCDHVAFAESQNGFIDYFCKEPDAVNNCEDTRVYGRTVCDKYTGDVIANSRELIFNEIERKRVRQEEKWGEQNHPILAGDDGHPCIFSHAANAAKKRYDDAGKAGNISWYKILDEEIKEAFAEVDPAKQKEELIQVAAVVVQMIECIDRTKK
jgi:hypothetical protein